MKDSRNEKIARRHRVNEGILGKLLFDSELAHGLYDEFYKDLTDKIKSGDKAGAMKEWEDLTKDFEKENLESIRWAKVFNEVQAERMKKYKAQIDAMSDTSDTASVDESYRNSSDEDAPEYDEYDDDYYDLDPVEEDRAHAALYGGDRTYCDCGKRLVPDEYGYFYCPVCNFQE